MGPVRLAERERAADGVVERARVPPAGLVRAHDQRRLGESDLGAGAADLRPGRPQNETISNQIIALPDGSLVDGFYLFKSNQNNQGDRGNSVAVDPLHRQGRRPGRSKRSSSPRDNAIGETDPEPIHCRPFITGNPPCTLVRSDGVIVDLAVDYSSGPHHGRHLPDLAGPPDNPFGDDLIMLSHSDDGGLTWSAPAKVNQTPSGTFTDQAFEPAVHVNASGVVAVSYYDFRNDVSGDGALTTDHWIVHSHDGGATWTENHLGGPFDLHQAPYARGYFVGDYQGLDAQGNVVPAAVHARQPGQRHRLPEPKPNRRVHQQRVLTRGARGSGHGPPGYAGGSALAPGG